MRAAGTGPSGPRVGGRRGARGREGLGPRCTHGTYVFKCSGTTQKLKRGPPFPLWPGSPALRPGPLQRPLPALRPPGRPPAATTELTSPSNHRRYHLRNPTSRPSNNSKRIRLDGGEAGGGKRGREPGRRPTAPTAQTATTSPEPSPSPIPFPTLPS